MNDIEKSILNQMWIYTASLKTLLWLRLEYKYSAQFDMTLDNLQSAAVMLAVESRRQLNEVKCQQMLRR